MRWAFALLAVLAAAPVQASADEAHDLAADIFARTYPGNFVSNTLQSLRNDLTATILLKSDKTRSDAEALADALVEPHVQELTAKVRDVNINAYVKDFTMANLRALDAFDRSTAGQQVLKAERRVTADALSKLEPVFRDITFQIFRQNAELLRHKGVTL